MTTIAQHTAQPAAPQTLIATLGMSAPVVSETLEKLLEKGVKITKVIILHTTHDLVLKPTSKLGLNECIEYINKNYPSIEVIPQSLGTDDFYFEEDHNRMMHQLLMSISQEKNAGSNVHIGIAGGRKTMSSSGHFAAYLLGCEGVYHVLLSDPEKKLTEPEIFKKGFDVESKYVTLVKMPNLNLYPILKSVINQIDPNKDLIHYLQEHSDLTKLFDAVSNELTLVASQKTIREKYLETRDHYTTLCQVVESILKHYAKKLSLFKPEFNTRVKQLASIFDKMERKLIEKNEVIEDPIERFTDIAGARVILFYNEDVERLCKEIRFSGDFTIIEDETPVKVSGYKARHFVVKLNKSITNAIPDYEALKEMTCEIQVKTIFEHAWGQAEHGLRYKSQIYQKAEEAFKKTVDEFFKEEAETLGNTQQNFGEIKKLYDSIKEK